MYLDCTIKIPDSNGKITKKTIKGTTYIYYEYARIYLKDKKYNTPRRICIGKQIPGQPALMLPNDKFLKIFPQEILPEEKQGYRSGCLRIGAYIVIRKVISDYRLDLMLARIVGKDAGLFLDLAAYTIITEGNAAQYYPDYAFNHPLMTEDMRIYSDSKVSDFLSRTTTDQRILFLNEWNEKKDHRERIYISYDSTNKNSQVGDIDLVEFGHPKDDQGKEIFNYSIAYDRNNREPLFYESYPGSIVDISQLQYTLGKAKGYGYRRVGFILDRGYFSKENIRFMDDNGYDFVIMAKGMKNWSAISYWSEEDVSRMIGKTVSAPTKSVAQLFGGNYMQMMKKRGISIFIIVTAKRQSERGKNLKIKKNIYYSSIGDYSGQNLKKQVLEIYGNTLQKNVDTTEYYGIAEKLADLIFFLSESGRAGRGKKYAFV